MTDYFISYSGLNKSRAGTKSQEIVLCSLLVPKSSVAFTT